MFMCLFSSKKSFLGYKVDLEENSPPQPAGLLIIATRPKYVG